MNHITELSALELAARLHNGDLKIAEVLDAYYAAIEASEFNCYITLCKEQAYERAAEIQQRLDNKEVRSRLAGVPIAVKDLICTKGVRTTAASKTLEHFVPPYDADAVERIHAADMIILGKTNTDEFAMGASTETSFFGSTKNPRNPAHIPGGSSGGSAAALAAYEAPLALGSDTGGSIRQPASHCGVIGLRPTYGAVSRHGVVALASSMDQVGPMARTAEDCAALFDIIKGKDPRDGMSMEYPDMSEQMRNIPLNEIGGLRIGIPKEFFDENLQPEIAQAVLAAKDKLVAMGAVAEEFSLPIAEHAVSSYYIIASAEASSNLAKYDGIKFGYCSEDAATLKETYVKSRSEGFGAEVKRRVMLGNYVLSAAQYDTYYKKAAQVRQLIRQALGEAFERFDVILSPTVSRTAPKLGETADPMRAWSDPYTATASLAGLPAVSLPCGEDADGLPIGLQLIGKPFSEAMLLRVGGSVC